MTDLDDDSSPQRDLELVNVAIIDPLKNRAQDCICGDDFMSLSSNPCQDHHHSRCCDSKIFVRIKKHIGYHDIWCYIS